MDYRSANWNCAGSTFGVSSSYEWFWATGWILTKKEIKSYPERLNDHFVTITTQLIGLQGENFDLELNENDKESNFCPKRTTYHEVVKQTKLLRNDSSTGPDGILVKFIRAAADHCLAANPHNQHVKTPFSFWQPKPITNFRWNFEGKKILLNSASMQDHIILIKHFLEFF